MKKILLVLCGWSTLSAMDQQQNLGQLEFTKSGSVSYEDVMGIENRFKMLSSDMKKSAEDNMQKDDAPKTLPSNGFTWLRNALKEAYADKQGELSNQFRKIDCTIMMQNSSLRALGFIAQNARIPYIDPIHIEKIGITAKNTKEQNFLALQAVYQKPKLEIGFK